MVKLMQSVFFVSFLFLSLLLLCFLAHFQRLCILAHDSSCPSAALCGGNTFRSLFHFFFIRPIVFFDGFHISLLKFVMCRGELVFESALPYLSCISPSLKNGHWFVSSSYFGQADRIITVDHVLFPFIPNRRPIL